MPQKGDILVEGGVPILGDDGTPIRYEFCNADADIFLQSVCTQKETLDENYFVEKEKREKEMEIKSEILFISKLLPLT